MAPEKRIDPGAGVEAEGVPPPPRRTVGSLHAYDPDIARRLREASVHLTGIRYDALG